MRQHPDRHRPGQHLRRRREKDTVGRDGDTGSDHVLPQRDGPAGLIDRQRDAEQRQAEQQARRDRHDDEPCIGQARGAEMDAAIDEVERAIEDVRPRHQDHARADRDQPQRGTQLVANRQAADDAGDERRAERLEKDVCAHTRHAAPQNGTGSGTHEYQRRRDWMLDAEDDR